MSNHEPEQISDDAGDEAPPTLIPVRRRPNIVAFLLTGAVIGIIAAAVVANLPDSKPSDYSTGTAFAYFAVIFGTLGTLLGALAALWADRRAGR
ncbi:hypothetical protein [Yimella sp. cx-51]|uniref:hypothetical protein n=1 Tax=Yimella sp. cx-51 TaxID=2770551 RepID=UPI00165E54C4|nr:hypothetical protein [Yimella sp. cx-51]MBC9955739.1 hypothetical protein [Yimella sp. cx-51]QTH37696.1 hypothetical protein J5M86_12690 [Yimella sp. cx-51]